MKKTVLFSMLLLAAFFFAKAENYKGGQIAYEWNTDSSYNIYVQTFLPCTGPTQPVPDSIYVCYFNSCNTISGSMVLHRTQDSAATPPQLRSYFYKAEFVVPSVCDQWTFYTSIAGRDSAVNVNSVNSNIYLEATLNSNFTHVNMFQIMPNTTYNPYLLANVPYTIFGAGAQGETYETVMPRTAPANFLDPNMCQNSYAATDLSFSDSIYNLYDNPIATNHTYSLIPSSGNRQFIPNASGFGKNIIAIKATKSLNGVVIGTTTTDMEYTVVSDTGYHQITQYLNTNSIVGGYWDGQAIILKPDTTLEFCLTGICENTLLDIISNYNAALPNSSVTYTFAGDTINACFTWNPSDADTGAHTLQSQTVFYPPTDCDNTSLVVSAGLMETIINVIRPTSVNNLSNNTAVKIFPNPAQNRVYIEAPVAMQLTITGLDGRTLLQRSNANSIDVSNLPDGLYLLRVADLSGRLMKMEKLIKTATK